MKEKVTKRTRTLKLKVVRDLLGLVPLVSISVGMPKFSSCGNSPPQESLYDLNSSFVVSAWTRFGTGD